MQCCGVQAKKKRTVAEALQGNQWIQDISGALPVKVLLEYLKPWAGVHNPPLLENKEDRFAGSGRQTGISLPPRHIWPFSMVSIRLRGLMYSAKRELRESANSLFGL